MCLGVAVDRSQATACRSLQFIVESYKMEPIIAMGGGVETFMDLRIFRGHFGLKHIPAPWLRLCLSQQSLQARTASLIPPRLAMVTYDFPMLLATPKCFL